MRVNGQRLLKQLQHLGMIGFEEGKGTSRMAYSSAYLEGAAYVKGLMEEAGLTVTEDCVGNLLATLPGTDPDRRIIATGSHLDSVPGGGIYDGPLGVLGAIECIRTMKEQGYRPVHTLQVIAFEEEEGNVVGGTFGSRCMTGQPLDDSVLTKMKEHGMNEQDVKDSRIDETQYAGYLELHIEQGGILEAHKKKIGIVGGIVGIVRFRTTVEGFSNHAGSTPMMLRDDAFEKTCRFVADLMDRVRAKNDTMVCTVGTISLDPGAVNVIPGRTEFVIEMRDRTMDEMYEVIDEMRRDYKEQGVTITQYLEQLETPCAPEWMDVIRTAADNLGLSRMEMFSGAGHDMMNMGKVMPSAMIFIPSKDGVSHRIEEYSSPEDIENGANVLLESLILLDQKA